MKKVMKLIAAAFALLLCFSLPISAYTDYDFAGHVTTSYTQVSVSKQKETPSSTKPRVKWTTSTNPSYKGTFGVYYTELKNISCDSVAHIHLYELHPN